MCAINNRSGEIRFVTLVSKLSRLAPWQTPWTHDRLDICSTLHMSVTLDDLDWCQDQIMPGESAYLIALPTRTIRC